MIPPAKTRRWLAAALLALACAACTSRPDPVTLDEGMVTVQNQTALEWRNVVITVNDHFRGAAAKLLPGGVVRASVNEFKTAFGQTYNRTRQSVYKIEVTATDAAGQPVHVEWSGRQAPR